MVRRLLRKRDSMVNQGQNLAEIGSGEPRGARGKEKKGERGKACPSYRRTLPNSVFLGTPDPHSSHRRLFSSSDKEVNKSRERCEAQVRDAALRKGIRGSESRYPGRSSGIA